MTLFRFARTAAWIPPCAIILFAFPAGAVSPDGGGEAPPVVTDTIRVPGRPITGEGAGDSPYFATVLDIEEESRRMLSVADVIERAAGIHVRRYGSLGSFTTASIRASSPGQVEIYLDGVPLNSAQWGTTDLSELPLDHLSTATVYRSGAPAFLGTSGIGGVIDLRSRSAGDGSTALSVTAGSYNTWKTTAMQSGRVGETEYIVSLRRLRSDGDFLFLYDPGTRFLNGTDDTVMARGNNRFTENNMMTRISFAPVSGWQVRLHDDWLLKENGIPGHGNLIYKEASADHRRHMTSATIESPELVAHRLQLDFTGYSISRRDRYYNPANESGLNRNDVVQNSKTLGARAVATGFWFEANQQWTVVLEGRAESFLPEEATAAARSFERRRDRVDLSVEDQAAYLSDRLKLFASWRSMTGKDNYFGPPPFGRPPIENDDAHTTRFHGFSFGMTGRLSSLLTVRAARTEYARFPTLFEIFGTDGEVRSNTMLVPEEGVTWDGGLIIEKSAPGRITGRLELSAYRSTRDSLIYFVQNSQRNFVARNLEDAVVRGVEVEANLRVGRRFRASGSFTTQDARHTGTVSLWEGKWLPYVSPREFYGRLSWDVGRFSARYEYDYHDGWFRDRANTDIDRAEARAYHGAGIECRFHQSRFIVDIDVQNIGDVRSDDAFGYPMPGRTVYMTTQFRRQKNTKG